MIENEPEMSACEAMIAAAVASTTSGSSAHDGASRKNGCSTAGIEQQQRALAQVVQHQRRKHQRKPRDADRLLAEVPHVRVQRLAAGDDEEHRAEHGEAGEAVGVRRT